MNLHLVQRLATIEVSTKHWEIEAPVRGAISLLTNAVDDIDLRWSTIAQLEQARSELAYNQEDAGVLDVLSEAIVELKIAKSEAIDKITLQLDGDRWCALIGENLQVGEAGFGEDPISALIDLRSKLPSAAIEVHPRLADWGRSL